MGNSLFHVICRMGIFMICAQAVVHFRPKEAYEKYLKLLVSVMVLIQVFLPIGSYLLGDGRRDAANALEQFGLELEARMREAEQEAATADKILEEMTLEEVFRRLEEQRPEEHGLEEQELGEQGLEKQSTGIVIGPIEPVAIEPIRPLDNGQ